MKVLPFAAAGIVMLGALSLAQARTLAPADKTFAMTAAAAGQAEIAEARIALGKTQNPDVKNFAQRIDRDHTQAGKELTQIAQGDGMTLPTQPAKPDEMRASKLAKLTGADFDRAYVTGQVTAHQQAVALFKRESQTGKDSDLKSFAAKTLPVLEDHLRMAQTLAAKK